MILPYLTYGNIVWGNACKSTLLNINRLQKRALRVCCDEKKVKSEALFGQLKKLTVKNINYMQIVQLVHRFYYNINILPRDIASLFEKSSDVHGHSTRAADSMSLFCYFGRLNLRKNALKICAPPLWNIIPLSLRQISSSILFKKKYKHYLLNLQTDHN